MLTILSCCLESVTNASNPSTNVNVTNATLFVRNVQGNILHWVKLHTRTISEAVIAGAVFVASRCWVVLAETAITHTDQAINASPIVDTVSWASSDGVVLCFVVNRRAIAEAAFFSVSERSDITQLRITPLVTVLQVEA